MTFLELQTEVFRRLEESSASPDLFLLQDVKDAINEGYEEISDSTEWYETSQTINLTTGIYQDLTSVLTKPFLSIKRIFNNVTNYWLRAEHYKFLDEKIPQWEIVIGEPEVMILRGLWWLGLWPKENVATGTVTIKHSALPTALSADGDVPGFPVTFHIALADYATFELFCQIREFNKAANYYKDYVSKESALKDHMQGQVSLDRVHRMGGIYG